MENVIFEWFEIFYISDRIQTNLVCHYFLLLVFVSQVTSEPTFDEIDILPESNKYDDASAIGTAVQTYRFWYIEELFS